MVQDLFTYSFYPDFSPKNQKIQKIVDQLNLIDALIEKSAPLWPLAQMDKVDLAVLRLAVYEIAVEKQNPQKAIIDEAIELAKEFGGDSSSKLVNGVLGSIINFKK